MSNTESAKPIAYSLAHVDTDRHAAFRLTRRLPVVPSPILIVGNVASVLHTRNMAMHVNAPHHPRVLVKGDWS